MEGEDKSVCTVCYIMIPAEGLLSSDSLMEGHLKEVHIKSGCLNVANFSLMKERVVLKFMEDGVSFQWSEALCIYTPLPTSFERLYVLQISA